MRRSQNTVPWGVPWRVHRHERKAVVQRDFFPQSASRTSTGKSSRAAVSAWASIGAPVRSRSAVAKPVAILVVMRQQNRRHLRAGADQRVQQLVERRLLIRVGRRRLDHCQAPMPDDQRIRRRRWRQRRCAQREEPHSRGNLSQLGHRPTLPPGPILRRYALASPSAPGRAPRLLVYDDPTPCPYLEGPPGAHAVAGPDAHAERPGVRRAPAGGRPPPGRPPLPDPVRELSGLRAESASRSSASPPTRPKEGSTAAASSGSTSRSAHPELAPEKVALYNRHKHGRALSPDGQDIDEQGYRAFLVDTCCDSLRSAIATPASSSASPSTAPTTRSPPSTSTSTPTRGPLARRLLHPQAAQAVGPGGCAISTSASTSPSARRWPTRPATCPTSACSTGAGSASRGERAW